MFDLVIKGGRVVTPSGVGDYNVAVSGQHVAAVSTWGAEEWPARQTIDATGKIVVPGGIEPHAHVDWKIPQDPRVRTQNATGASRACAFGGTTTIIDSAGYTPAGGPLESIAETHKKWVNNSYIDYSFHCVLLGSAPHEHFEQVPEVLRQGITSVKVYTFGPRQQPNQVSPQRIDDGPLYFLMEKVKKSDGILLVYAENDSMVNSNREALRREGRIGYENFAFVHTGLTEEIEFVKVLTMAERARTPLYFVHVSSKEAVRIVASARRRGLPVYGEATHLYMEFSNEEYAKPDGLKYHCYPALKSSADCESLWGGIVSGDLSTVGTTDVTTSYEIKMRWKTIFDARGGHVGVETRVPYMFSEGVAKRGMPLERFVAATSSNAAKIFGMYPRKGAIMPGSDADLVIIDPRIRKTLALSDLHADSDYSVWEGREFEGWPVTTILRGKIIVDHGRLLGSQGDGRFIERRNDPGIRDGAVC